MKATATRVIFFLIIFSAGIGKSQVYDWASPLAPTLSNSLSQGFDVAVDSVGNVYMAGGMQGDFDADPRPGVSMLYMHGASDAFLCKYNSTGSLIWAFNIGGTNNAALRVQFFSVTCDNAGNVIVCGMVNLGGMVDFDPGPGIYNMNANVFIAKYDSGGNFIWAISPVTRRIYTNGWQLQASIKTDKTNNIYMTGFFGDTCDFDPGPDTCTLATRYNSCDIFLAKYTSTGTLCWAKQFGNTGYDYGFTLDVDDSANVYFAGTIDHPTDFDAGPGTNILNGVSPYTSFIAKYDSSGNHIWAFAIRPFGVQSSWVHIFDLKLDHNGDIYVTGILQGTCDFDPGPGTANLSSSGSVRNSFIAKYSSSGNYLWGFVLLQSNALTSESGLSIGIDANNDLIAGGYFKGTVDFDPGVGVSAITTGPGFGIYIAKYSPLGNYQWAFSLGDTALNTAFGITTDNAGAFYISGQFYGLVDFDPGPAVKNLYAPASSSSTWQQAYVAKYFPDDPLPVEMLSFTGKNKGEKNILEWVTASEINNSGFEIERSENAGEFSKIGFVAGHGNSTSQLEYKFEDDYIKKDYYYRLKQVDYDGRFEYSDIIFLKKKSSATFDVYPNLVVDRFFINGIDERSVIEVVDVLGRVVLTFNGLNEIDFVFPAGIYFVRVKGEEVVKRIVKI